MGRRGSMVNGVSRPPVYGPYEYGNPAHQAIFGVPAERVHRALQRTRADWEADCAKWRRENPDLAADLARAVAPNSQ
jgi:hypothetical protein